MKFEKLQPGQVVYDVGRQKMGNTTMTTVAVWLVHIVSIDATHRTVVASWNGNRAKIFGAKAVARWRVKRPVLVKQSFGYRLARRNELPAPSSPAVVTPLDSVVDSTVQVIDLSGDGV